MAIDAFELFATAPQTSFAWNSVLNIQDPSPTLAAPTALTGDTTPTPTPSGQTTTTLSGQTIAPSVNDNLTYYIAFEQNTGAIGESQDQVAVGTFFQLTNFSFSDQSAGGSASGGAGAGKVTFNPLNLELTQPSLMPQLVRQLTSGSALKGVVIVGLAADGTVVTRDNFAEVPTSQVSVDNSGVTAVTLQYAAVSATLPDPAAPTATLVPAASTDLTYYIRFNQDIDNTGVKSGAIDGSTLYQLSGFSFDNQSTIGVGGASGGAGTGKVTFDPLKIELSQAALTPALLQLLDDAAVLQQVDVLGYGPDGTLVTDDSFQSAVASDLSVGSGPTGVTLQYGAESFDPASAPPTLAGQTIVPPASAALTYYVTFGQGLDNQPPPEGETSDPVATFYQLSGFSFDDQSAATLGSGTGGAGTGKVTFNPLNLELTQPSLTPAFFRELTTSGRLKDVVVVGVAADGTVVTRDNFIDLVTSNVATDNSGTTAVTLQYGAVSAGLPDAAPPQAIVPAVTPDLTYYIRFNQDIGPLPVAGETTDSSSGIDGSALYQLSGFSFDNQGTLDIGSATGAGAGTVTLDPLKIELSQPALTPALLKLLGAGAALQQVDVLGYGPDGTLVTDDSFQTVVASDVSVGSGGPTGVTLQYATESFDPSSAPATLTGQTVVPPASPSLTYYVAFEPGNPGSVPGETQDPAANAIFYQLSGFSFDDQSTGGSATGGAGTGKVTFNPLNLELTQPSLTPALVQELTTGTHLKDVVIVGLAADGTVVTRENFAQVLTSQVSVNDSGTTGVSLQYAALTLTSPDAATAPQTIVPAATPDLTYYVRFNQDIASATPVAGETTDSSSGIDGSTLYQLSGFSFDNKAPADIGSATGGAGAGKVTFDPLQLELSQPAVMPALLQLLKDGTALQEVDVLGYGPDGTLVTDDSFKTAIAESLTSGANGETGISLGYESESIQAFALGTFAPVAPDVVEQGETTVIGAETLGFAGETLTVSQTAGSGKLSLGAVIGGVQQVIYTAPASIPASTQDDVAYQLIDQSGDVVAETTASIQLDAGPSIVAATPAVVEKGQTTVIGTVTAGLAGDTLTLTKTQGSGTLSLGAVVGGVQQVIYTAPGAIAASAIDAVAYTVGDQHGDAMAAGSANVQLDSGPKAGNANLFLAPGASVDLTSLLLSQDTPGLAGDTLTLTGDGTAGTRGHVTLTHGDLVYTAPASGTDVFSYTVSDQLGGTATAAVDVSIASNKNGSIALTGGGNIVVTTDGNHSVSGGTGNNFVSLGSGNDSVSLGGNGNTIVLGDGNDSATTGDGSRVTLGNGNDSVSTGAHSVVAMGNGNDTVTAGANSSITLGNGNDLVFAGANSTISVGSGNNTVFAGSNDTITLGKGKDVVAFGVNPSPLTIGNEVVNGFGKGDTLEISRQLMSSFSPSDVTQMATGAKITIDQNDSIMLTGVAAASVTASSFKFV